MQILDKKTLSTEDMAKLVIELIPDYASINLGIGMPTMIAEILPSDKNVMIHSENGVLGVGERPSKKEVSPTLINAGKETISEYLENIIKTINHSPLEAFLFLYYAFPQF